MSENKDNLTDNTLNILNKSIKKSFSMLDNEKENRIKEESMEILEEVYRNNSYHGKKSENLVGAVVYLTSSKFFPVQPEEIYESLDISKKSLFNTVRYLMKEGYVKSNPGSEPTDYIEKYSKKLNLDEDLKQEAIEIGKKTEDAGSFSGRAPSGLAASSIYLASSLNGGEVTQKDLSEVCGKSEVTIRKNYKSQKSELINTE